MKSFFSVFFLGAVLVAGSAASAADTRAELDALVAKVNAKLETGAEQKEANFTDELKGFDELFARHKGEETDDVAAILMTEASFYQQVLADDAKATKLFQQVKADFPGTKTAGDADKLLAGMAKEAEIMRIQSTLRAGTVFPDFQEKDLHGDPLSVSSFKGKYVLVDFWATWCPPCMAGMPGIIKAYEKYHAKGFEIVGISLDDDKDELTAVLQEKHMTWAQYFDGKHWENKLAVKYGIGRLPASYLLDKEGKIVAADLDADELDKTLAAVLK